LKDVGFDNMDSQPLVSVIIPVFNAERFVAQSIQSVLSQSYENLECIIVDDGSSDGSWEIIERFQKIDSRVHPIRQARNQGVSVVSNIALQAANGKYVARMDSDDISLADRFSLQIRFMEAHPEVGILGTGMRCMDETGKLLAAPPIFRGDLAIRWHMMFENPFFNPTIMFRKSVIDSLGLKYEISAIYGDEDYDFVSRLIAHTQGENLSEILLYYRMHPSSLSYRYAAERNDSVAQRLCRTVEMLLPEIAVSPEDIIDLHRAIMGISEIDKRRRSQLLPVYLDLWAEFCFIHKTEPELSNLKRGVIAWATRMILYPPFQTGSLKALWLLTRTEWRWPLFFLMNLPYYLARRRVS